MSVLTRKPDLDTCPICFEPFFEDGAKVRAIVGLDCEHHFHAGCIATYVYKRNEKDNPCLCPTCRLPISDDVQALIKNTDNKEEFEEVVDGVTNVYTGASRTLVRRERYAENILGTEHYTGPKGFERRVSFVCDGTTIRFLGEKGEERKHSMEHKNGDVAFYKGPQNNESVVLIKTASGVDIHYEGPPENEFIVRRVLQNGDVEHFEGGYRTERKTKVCCANGDTKFYNGSSGFERLVKLTCAEGDKIFFNGEKDAERKITVMKANKDFEFYNGSRGNERLIKICRDGGDQEFYNGAKGVEFLVSKLLASGDTEDYNGCRGQEYMVKKYVAEDSTTHTYTGSVPGSEVLESILYPDERVEYFVKGSNGANLHVRTEYPDGREELFKHENGKKRLVCKKEIVFHVKVRVTHICKNGKEREQSAYEFPRAGSLDSRAKRMRIAEKFLGAANAQNQ